MTLYRKDLKRGDCFMYVPGSAGYRNILVPRLGLVVADDYEDAKSMGAPVGAKRTPNVWGWSSTDDPKYPDSAVVLIPRWDTPGIRKDGPTPMYDGLTMEQCYARWQKVQRATDHEADKEMVVKVRLPGGKYFYKEPRDDRPKYLTAGQVDAAITWHAKLLRDKTKESADKEHHQVTMDWGGWWD